MPFSTTQNNLVVVVDVELNSRRYTHAMGRSVVICASASEAQQRVVRATTQPSHSNLNRIHRQRRKRNFILVFPVSSVCVRRCVRVSGSVRNCVAACISYADFFRRCCWCFCCRFFLFLFPFLFKVTTKQNETARTNCFGSLFVPIFSSLCEWVSVRVSFRLFGFRCAPCDGVYPYSNLWYLVAALRGQSNYIIIIIDERTNKRTKKNTKNKIWTKAVKEWNSCVCCVCCVCWSL